LDRSTDGRREQLEGLALVVGLALAVVAFFTLSWIAVLFTAAIAFGLAGYLA
jgi:hypothetical protein